MFCNVCCALLVVSACLVLVFVPRLVFVVVCNGCAARICSVLCVVSVVSLCYCGL